MVMSISWLKLRRLKSQVQTTCACAILLNQILQHPSLLYLGLAVDWVEVKIEYPICAQLSFRALHVFYFQ